MSQFLNKWAESAYVSLGFFWMALWAFILGYAISAMIQIFVTEKRMQRIMGDAKGKSMLLGTFFGFISSSCSFSALSTTKSLFKKGASFSSSIAFLLSSTNLVIELGIVISIFLGWQFVVGEYIGGILLILVSWLFIKLLNPQKLIQKARQNLESDDQKKNDKTVSPKKKIKSAESWRKVGRKYGMEWKMVWKDVTIGFTIAGIIAAFVPTSFFETLFINSGSEQSSYDFLTLLSHTVIGPVAAFITFIGSMGNIPLAALLFDNGVSFAGVFAFIFSDLVVFPVLRINAKYYGWKMSFFILFLLFISLIVSSILLHYGFNLFDALPSQAEKSIIDQTYFKLDYTFFMNIIFFIISAFLIYIGFFKTKNKNHEGHNMSSNKSLREEVLKYLAILCYLWLLSGVVLKFVL